MNTSERAIAAARAGLQPASHGLPLREANALLEPGYLQLENGYCRLDGGVLYVAVHTPMPGVSGEMIDWWFAWHGQESARYQLWHPRDHISASWRRPVRWDGGDRAAWQALYRGNISDVDEYIGPRRMKLAIDFADPADYLDVSRFEAAATDTVVCARTVARTERVAAGHVLHQVRRVDNGTEMRSRFWLADFDPSPWPLVGSLLSPLLNTAPMRRVLVPNAMGRHLLLHCAEEMAHLAEFLPDLFKRVTCGGSSHADSRRPSSSQRD